MDVQFCLSRGELTGLAYILLIAYWLHEKPMVSMADLSIFSSEIDQINTRRKLLMGQGRIAAGEFGMLAREIVAQIVDESW